MDKGLVVSLRIKDLLSKQLGRTAKKVEGFTSRVERGFLRLARLPALLTGLSLPFLAKGLLEAGAKIEVFRNQLIAVSDSAKKADNALAQIREFARTSPLETEDVVQSYVRLRAVGLDPTMEQMRTMGGVAVLFNKQLTDVLDSFIGLNKRTLRQVGIEIDRTGKNAIIQSGNIRKEVSKDSASIRAALLETWQERFPDALKIAGDSFKAQMAVFRSGIFEFSAEMSETFMPEIKRIVQAGTAFMEDLRDKVIANKAKIIAKVKRAAAVFRDLWEIITKLGGWLAKNWELLAMAALGVKLVNVTARVVRFTQSLSAMNIALMANPIVLVTAAVAGLGVVFVRTAEEWRRWRNDMVDNAALEAKADEIKRLTTLLGLYDQMLSHVEITQKDGRQSVIDLGTASEDLRAEIANLEDQMGHLGLSLEGGLFERIAAAEGRLASLTGKAKQASAAVQELGTGSTGPTDEKGGKAKSGFIGIDAGVAEQEKAFWDEIKQIRIQAAIEINDYGARLAEQRINTEVTTADRMAQVWTDYKEGMEGRMRGMWNTITDLQATSKDRMLAITNQLYRATTDILFDYLKIFIKSQIIESALHTATSKKKQAESISNAATSGAEAAADAGKSVANVPYVGPILAAAAIATISGIVFSLISRAKSFRSGTIDAPGGMAYVHRDEMIELPKHSRVYNAQQTRQMMANAGGLNLTLQVNGNVEQSAVKPLQSQIERVGRDVVAAMRGGYLPSMATLG